MFELGDTWSSFLGSNVILQLHVVYFSYAFLAEKHLIIPLMIQSNWIFAFVNQLHMYNLHFTKATKGLISITFNLKWRIKVQSNIQVHSPCPSLQQLLSWQTTKRGRRPKPLFQIAPTRSQTTLYNVSPCTNSQKPFKSCNGQTKWPWMLQLSAM